MYMTDVSKLHNPELFKDNSYVNGEWVESTSGKRFEIYGNLHIPHISQLPNISFIDPGTGKQFASSPANTADDVPAAVEAAHTAFLSYRNLNPRKRAKLLLEWHKLIESNAEDLAQILTHETGKPLAESKGEIDYSLGFTWWFAGEAERVRGTVSQPSVDDRRVFTIKQPIGVAVALVPWNFPIA